MQIHIEPADVKCMDETEIQRTYQLVLDAYAATEEEIWGKNYVRMPLDEYLEILKNGEVLIARENNRIVGTIYVHRLSETHFGFGLLASDFALRGQGIGRRLIQAAEDVARLNGASRMVLEILRPRDVELPFKTVLAAWYERLGYQKVKTMSFLDLKSEKVEKAKQLKVPAVFDVYQKSLN